jgi:glycosyltransferase involved in cell wall biosynthesis
MRISCTLIIRDEASTLEACLASIRPHVDELVIIDTGSTDDSPSIAARYADKFEVWTGCNDAEGRIADFSAARNHAISLATGDALAWFDGDDLVRGASELRKLASEAYRSTAGQAWAYLMPYEYERDAAGRVTVLQWRERLVYPLAGFEWRGPVHEGLLGKAGTTPTYMQTDAVTVEHQAYRSSKPREQARNLRILEQHVRKTGEADARSLHYLGAELMQNGRIGEACYWFRRHTLLSGWSDERCLSLMHLARISFAMGDYDQASEWAMKAMVTKAWPEPYWLAGQAWVSMAESGIDPEHNLRRGTHMLQRGFELDTGAAQSLLMRDPTVRYDARAWLAPALAKLGNIAAAIECAELGLAGKPEHAELKANLANWKRGRVLEAVGELERVGAITEQAKEIVAATLRGDFKVERAPTRERNALLYGRRNPQQLDIIFFLGHQLEPWTPRTLERDGMGGSETMAWEMSKRLAALGHNVRVYAHCDAEHPEGTYDGVEWFDEQAFLQPLSCDVLISSRRSDVAHANHISATARVLWVHDVHVGEGFTPDQAVRFDLIWCLSNWHREHFLQCYPWLPPGKVEVTRNGIDTKRFENARGITRSPHRAIYSSSPDRGLAAAIAAWPAVRAAIPDAELHVFYGFENWERTLVRIGDHPDPHCSRAALNALKVAIAKTPGIVLRGRVNGAKLAEEMLQASVWFYPTWFSETSCITAMEAQAAGLVCVCPPLAALAETVQFMSPDILDAFSLAEMGRPKYDRSFSLDALATDWQTRLTSLVEAQRENVVPKFMEAAQ